VSAGSAPATSHATLSAFTVSRHGDTVDVTVRQLANGWSAADRAALQRELREDGVPAIVGMPRAVADGTCTSSPLVAQVLKSPSLRRAMLLLLERPRHKVMIKIHTEKIPSGDQVGIAVDGSPRHRSLEVQFPGFLLTRSGHYLCSQGVG